MPNARQTNEEVEVSPFDDEFSGFIFKIQANMDPKHRDKLRLCVLLVVHSNVVWM